MSTGSFPGVKSGRGVTLIPHPVLVPWWRRSRAIPLFPQWAVRPVQSLSACTTVHFSFTFYTLWIVAAELQTARVAYFQRKTQLSVFSAYPDGSLSHLIRFSGVLLYVGIQPSTYQVYSLFLFICCMSVLTIETSGRLHPLWPHNKRLHTPRTTDYRHSRQDRWIQTELVSALAKNTTKSNPFKIIPLRTTRKENNWKTEEALARAVVTLETERIKQRVQSLMFMMMMIVLTVLCLRY